MALQDDFMTMLLSYSNIMLLPDFAGRSHCCVHISSTIYKGKLRNLMGSHSCKTLIFMLRTLNL